jgi:tRNA modification GTPase
MNPLTSSRDTIAAVATAPGRAAIGVVRISGQDLSPFIHALTGRSLVARRATLVTFHDEHGGAIDSGIALLYRAPNSYTGEDVLELQGHGGMVVLRAILERCLGLGARIAQPGEFTQRAVVAGKLDLVQAEAVIDLIDASTAQAARSAMRSLQGAFSSAVEALGREIVDLRAFVEAGLDFPEEDIDAESLPQLREHLSAVQARLDEVLDSARQGSLLREGVHIVLAGEPNVGKSSLLNRLAGEDLAIVTDVPGTTRDAIRQAIHIEGVPVHVVDTAGLRESADPVEQIGVQRAWAEIERADVVLHILDARLLAPAAGDPILEKLPSAARRITVMNKIDLAGREPGSEPGNGAPTVWVSAKTGVGVDLLRKAILQSAGWQPGHGEHAFLARERHLRALGAARKHLAAAEGQRQAELFAEELRLAHEALASITGEFTPDDLLGEIFQRFCIGK